MDHSMLLFISKVFFGFFAIMNPIANTPIFLGVASNFDEKHKNMIAVKSVITALIIVLAFIFTGHLVFTLFGISLPAFQITGGILIFYVGFELLQGKMSKVQTPNTPDLDPDQSSLKVAISPLAIPILAGPGTISTAMNFAGGGSLSQTLLTAGIFTIMCFITYLSFIFGEKLTNLLGSNLVSVISRLMGLILAVIGTDMVIAGIKATFKL